MQLLRHWFSLDDRLEDGVWMQVAKQFSLTLEMRNLALAMLACWAMASWMRWRVSEEEEPVGVGGELSEKEEEGEEEEERREEASGVGDEEVEVEEEEELLSSDEEEEPPKKPPNAIVDEEREG